MSSRSSTGAPPSFACRVIRGSRRRSFRQSSLSTRKLQRALRLFLRGREDPGQLGVAGGIPRGLFEPRPAPARARVDGHAARPFRLLHRHRGLRVRRGRRGRSRSRRRAAAASVGLRGPVHVDPRRPLPAQARDVRHEPRPGAHDRRRGRGHPLRRAALARLPAGRRQRHHRDGLPAGAGGAAALAGTDAVRVDRCQRHVEHDREPRPLRRPGDRRPAARGHQCRNASSSRRPCRADLRIARRSHQGGGGGAPRHCAREG